MGEEELFLAILAVDDDALRELVRINRALSKIFGGNRFNMASWLTSENVQWEDKTPVEIMMGNQSGMKSVRSYLEQAADRGA